MHGVPFGTTWVVIEMSLRELVTGMPRVDHGKKSGDFSIV
jgi:hypothetical protein